MSTRVSRAFGWVVAARRNESAAVRLFCLPYAGGGASAYAQWSGVLPGDIEVCPIELPGRQTRWNETAFTSAESLAEQLALALASELDKPYALFGHSMGSVVAFELARALRRRHVGGPVVLFVSGGPAPQLPRPQPPVRSQSDEQIVAKLRSLDGVSEEVYAEPELLELLLPTIRADFSVCETYQYQPEQPLDCPIIAFGGAEDQEVPAARMSPWREQTAGGFTQYLLPGGHFFMRSSQDALLHVICAELARALWSA